MRHSSLILVLFVNHVNLGVLRGSMDDEFLVEIMTDIRVIKTYRTVAQKVEDVGRQLGVQRQACELLVKVEKT